ILLFVFKLYFLICYHINMKTRVRFAPSPTGHLHVGGARTALFNYLFAKKTGGTFVLRIEDTDELRSTEESTKSIFQSMKWLGLKWDEGSMFDLSEKGEFGPYTQSVRESQGIYKKYAQQLLKEGKAYYCYCSNEELDARRKQAQLEKRQLKYDGRCRHLSAEQIEEFKKEGRKPVIRFKMPNEGQTVFEDLIHKQLKFENDLLYDFVMIKASGYPTYNFACVIDDHFMEMTHIIRGDDHISNTPMQLNVYKALNWAPPQYAHLSMILGSDGTRLSKRHGATSIEEYEKQGFLPETMKNYLALLGWGTSDSRDIFKKGELEEKFDLNGCQKSAASFDPVKLTWMNGEYIRQLSKEDLFAAAEPYLKDFGLNLDKANPMHFDIVGLEQEKYKLLTDVGNMVYFFFQDVKYDEEAIDKVLKAPDIDKILCGVKKTYAEISEFNDAVLEVKTREFAKANGFKNGQVFHPVRVSVSGKTKGPTLFKMIEYLGKEEVIKRIDKTLSLI
ncbi:MAG: glutamate--tRNA ligase, partial [Elusimicrobiota bacterium]|nr:glutamate--tRNA ligase [Elusimicrobiota bacterium]